MKKMDSEEVRNRYLDSVLAKIIGPGSENITTNATNEIISENPQYRYVTGILYPNMKVESSSEEELSKDTLEEDPENESGTRVDNNFKPTSFGITFYCTPNQEIHLIVEGAIYTLIYNPPLDLSNKQFEIIAHHVLADDKISDIFDFDVQHKTLAYAQDFKTHIIEYQQKLKRYINENQDCDWFDQINNLLTKLLNINWSFENKTKNKIKFKYCYQRVPFSVSKELIPRENNYQKISLDQISDGVELFIRTRTLSGKDNQKIQAVTLTLQNFSNQFLFQSKIKIMGSSNLNFFSSEDIELPNISKLDNEEVKLLFEYQDKKTYAFGHGISATWSPIDCQPEEIETSYVPIFELSPTSFSIPEMDEKILRPDTYLQENSSKTQIYYLNQFVNKYDDWINWNKKKIPEFAHNIPEFEKVARKNMLDCSKCSERMHHAISLLQSDKNLLEAFDLANEVMLLQRLKNSSLKEKLFKSRDYSEMQSDQNKKFMWRAFQLAFLLTTIESTVDPNSNYRDSLDLIWINTGGGKTEAYLFLIAVSILYQRLCDKETMGVSVIMRYTLRLLTAQQFERASEVICVLDYMRQKMKGKLGSTPISIGLWIGGNSTDNKIDQARKDFQSMCQGNAKSNKFPILTCPWCHKKESIVPIDDEKYIPQQWGYYALKFRGGTKNIQCQNKSCPFSKVLPIYFVDETIYKVQPTLLFGTVDKFAQIPLNSDTRNLFVAQNSKTDKKYTPNLIIQDELHLISGPLGSIVGLYETAWDFIIQKNGPKPKYVASTATIRNSIEQIKNLYNRKVFQFPANGLSIDDNFFVKSGFYNKEKNKFGRKYVGIMGSGKTKITTEVHLFGSMLASTKGLDFTTEQEEQYWTIVGYFNSIRELGRASALLMDNVQEELTRINRRYQLKGNNARQFNEFGNVELTSRVPSSEITNIIHKLQQSHDLSTQGSLSRAVDTVIATNMLSVGIDISRLNNMLVVGQPKLNSEYIQATSRVGRHAPGLVFTLYNSMRNRDRSHYESFTSFHQSMYRYVEPSSVTPFSEPSLGKALSAVLVAMARISNKNLTSDNSPIKIDDYHHLIDQIVEFVSERIGTNDPDGLYSSYAKNKIKDFFKNWEETATDSKRSNGQLNYYVKKSTENTQSNMHYLLRNYEIDSFRYPESSVAMNSMRDVDNMTNIIIDEDDDDD